MISFSATYSLCTYSFPRGTNNRKGKRAHCPQIHLIALSGIRKSINESATQAWTCSWLLCYSCPQCWLLPQSSYVYLGSKLLTSLAFVLSSSHRYVTATWEFPTLIRLSFEFFSLLSYTVVNDFCHLRVFRSAERSPYTLCLNTHCKPLLKTCLLNKWQGK